MKTITFIVALIVSCASYSDSGMAIGNSVNRMLSNSACNVIKSQKLSYGRGYTIKVHAIFHSGSQLSTTSFGRDKHHAIARFLCEQNASEIRQFKYHQVK